MKPISVTAYTVAAPVMGIRFAVIADLHNQNAREVYACVKELKPDACLFIGDLFESPPRRRGFSYDEAALCLELLAPLSKLFWVPGNHDFTLPDDLAAAMDRLGVTRLDNRAVFFRGVWIGGLSSAQYLTKKEPDLAFLSSFSQKTGFKLLLSHHPEYYPKYIRQQPIDLTVSGHAHGGQWRFFGRGVYAPGQGLFPRYTKGLYEGRLLVSCGLKHSRIPRFFNPREILLLTVGETEPRVSE